MTQSPPEPGRGDMLARQERIEREIVRLSRDDQQSTIHQPWIPGTRRHDQRISELRSELSRLRNEGGGAPNPAGVYGTEQSPTLKDLRSPSDLPAREAIERAIDFIAREYRDPSYEPDGEWLPPEARKVHSDLCATLQPLSQGNGEAVGWPDIDAAVKAGLATRNPAPNAAPAGPVNVRTVTIGAAPPSQPEGVREALLEDGIRNLCYTAFQRRASGRNPDDGGECDWINDTLPIIEHGIKNLLATIPSRGLVEAAEWQLGIENAPKDADWILVCGPKWNGPSLAYFSDSQNENCWIEMPCGERLDETADRWMLVPPWEKPRALSAKGGAR